MMRLPDCPCPGGRSSCLHRALRCSAVLFDPRSFFAGKKSSPLSHALRTRGVRNELDSEDPPSWLNVTSFSLSLPHIHIHTHSSFFLCMWKKLVIIKKKGSFPSWFNSSLWMRSQHFCGFFVFFFLKNFLATCITGDGESPPVLSGPGPFGPWAPDLESELRVASIYPTPHSQSWPYDSL